MGKETNIANLLDVAYLAGVIDSDGFISAHRKKHKGCIYVAPLIGIAGTSTEPHALAKARWGGSLITYVPKNPTHRVQFMWQAVGERAAAAIREIQPFLRIKPKQAAVALEIWMLIGCGLHRTDPSLRILADQLSDMNMRNPPLKVKRLKEAR